MSSMPLLTENSREKGHLFRRISHLFNCLIPLLYYVYGQAIASFFFLTPQKLITLIVTIAAIIEALRLWKKWRFYGQRHYEINRISAGMWAIIAIGLVLLQAPSLGIGTALILSWALADPIMGEARLFKTHNYLVLALGLFIVYLIWFLGAIYLDVPWVLTLIIPPMIIAAEWLDFNSIDDNATMLLIPLVITLFLVPWLQ